MKIKELIELLQEQNANSEITFIGVHNEKTVYDYPIKKIIKWDGCGFYDSTTLTNSEDFCGKPSPKMDDTK